MRIIFYLCTAYIVLIFLGSIIYSFFYNDYIPIVSLKFDNGELVARPPYSPVLHFPLGADNLSQDVFFVLLTGAKYTIGIAIVVAISRILISLILGVLIGVYLKKHINKFAAIIDTFHFFPVTLLVYLCLYDILIFDYQIDGQFTYSYSLRVAINVIFLILVGLPPIIYLISKECSYILDSEFLNGVKILGGNKLYIISRHIPLFLFPKLLLVTAKEVIQVLLLLIHLGILKMFIGGGKMKVDIFENEVFQSLSNEWSGLISNWSGYIWTTHAWLAFVPVLIFSITILSLKGIIKYAEYKLFNQHLNKTIKGKHVSNSTEL